LRISRSLCNRSNPLHLATVGMDFGKKLVQVQFPAILYHSMLSMPHISILPEIVHVDLQGLFRLIFP